MPKISRGKIDAIQPACDAVARELGAEIVACSQYAGMGYDREYLLLYECFHCEIKSTPTAELTEKEKKRKKQFESAGVPYYIIRSPEQLRELLERHKARVLYGETIRVTRVDTAEDGLEEVDIPADTI